MDWFSVWGLILETCTEGNLVLALASFGIMYFGFKKQILLLYPWIESTDAGKVWDIECYSGPLSTTCTSFMCKFAFYFVKFDFNNVLTFIPRSNKYSFLYTFCWNVIISHPQHPWYTVIETHISWFSLLQCRKHNKNNFLHLDVA